MIDEKSRLSLERQPGLEVESTPRVIIEGSVDLLANKNLGNVCVSARLP